MSTPETGDPWAYARHLVVIEKVPYAEAAKRAGLPLSTLQKRASREQWLADRKSADDYASRVRQLKVKTLEAALNDNDPQKVFAWRQVEAAFPEHRYHKAEEDPRAKLAIAVEVIEFLVEYLTDHDRNALAALAPHITPFGKSLEDRWL